MLPCCAQKTGSQTKWCQKNCGGMTIWCMPNRAQDIRTMCITAQTKTKEKHFLLFVFAWCTYIRWLIFTEKLTGRLLVSWHSWTLAASFRCKEIPKENQPSVLVHPAVDPSHVVGDACCGRKEPWATKKKATTAIAATWEKGQDSCQLLKMKKIPLGRNTMAGWALTERKR